MNKASRSDRIPRGPEWGWRIAGALLLLATLLAVAGGCGGALNATATYTAAPSTIGSAVDTTDPAAPVYTLKGYAFIDRIRYLITVQADGATPAVGYYQRFAGAQITLATATTSTSTRADNTGYFEFPGLPADVPTYTLTVATSGSAGVKFTVNIAGPTITPVTSS
ncbi:MAG TPA: hypothetical protein VGM19_11930 [Armatimonadota bacterium]